MNLNKCKGNHDFPYDYSMKLQLIVDLVSNADTQFYFHDPVDIKCTY